MLCPTCKKPIDEAVERPTTVPFCSERCRLIDLGRWLDGKYTIPVDGMVADEGNSAASSTDS